MGIFLLYILVLYSILGTHLYSGSFYNECHSNVEPWTVDLNVSKMCSKSGIGAFQCPDGDICGTPLQFGLSDQEDDMLNKAYMYYGIHNFNNLF